MLLNEQDLAFIALVRERGRQLYRDLPWRRTRDAYAVLVSEVMLQQTQVARVLSYWPAWLERFSTVAALAAAPLASVLAAWQGLGYNRRAKQLHQLAQICADKPAATIPTTYPDLLALPGVGPATAAGVCAFAYNQPSVYLETNVRAVYLHHYFAGRTKVPDAELTPIIQRTCDPHDSRGWYYALLDYGAWLKHNGPNPSRRSATQTRQSPFEGSRRQARAALLRLVLARPGRGSAELARALADQYQRAGREPVRPDLVTTLVEELQREGFIAGDALEWHIAG
jgi:A/G-specific adenine glycosylase